MADKEPPMRNSTLMQTRTAVIGIVAGFVLGSAGGAVAASPHHHRGGTCSSTQIHALRVIASSATASHAGSNVSYPALKADAELAQAALTDAGC